MIAGDEVKNETTIPIITAVAGNVIWGFSFLFARIAMKTAPVVVYLSIRFILAFLLLNIFILSGKEKVSLRGKKIMPLLLLSIAEPIYFYFETFGIVYTNATFAGVILAVVPVVSLAAAALVLKEYPTRRQTLFCILPVAGVILMTISGKEMGIIRPIGVFLLICCCLTSAVYKIANRKSAEEFTAFERTYFVLLICAIWFTMAAVRETGGNLSEYLAPLHVPSFVFAVIILSVFCSVAAGLLVNYAAARMPVVNLATFGTLTSVVAAFAGILFLDEPMSAMSLAGTVLILYGIWQVTRPENAEAEGKPSE